MPVFSVLDANTGESNARILYDGQVIHLGTSAPSLTQIDNKTLRFFNIPMGESTTAVGNFVLEFTVIIDDPNAGVYINQIISISDMPTVSGNRIMYGGTIG